MSFGGATVPTGYVVRTFRVKVMTTAAKRMSSGMVLNHPASAACARMNALILGCASGLDTMSVPPGFRILRSSDRVRAGSATA